MVYSPDLDLSQKVEVLETLDIRARLGLVIDLMRNVLADLALEAEAAQLDETKMDQDEAVAGGEIGPEGEE